MTYQSTQPVSNFQPIPAGTPVAFRLMLRDPFSDLLTREVCLLRDCIEVARKQWGFRICAAVILPEQMQMLASFDTGEFGVKQALKTIQMAFEAHAGDTADEIWDGPATLTMLGWSAVPIRTSFIEAAPVRARLVDHPSEWRYSTAYRNQSGDGLDTVVDVA